MKRSAVCLALIISGCSQSESPQAAYDLAHEAQAEAVSATTRVSDLEMTVSDLEAEIENLRSELQTEASERANGDSNLEGMVHSHSHY